MNKVEIEGLVPLDFWACVSFLIGRLAMPCPIGIKKRKATTETIGKQKRKPLFATVKKFGSVKIEKYTPMVFPIGD